MELIIATHNKNKVIEFKKKLKNKFSKKSLSDIGFIEDIPENEDTKKECYFQIKLHT